MLAFHLEFSATAIRDFELIFDHLYDSYLAFGESTEEAFDHAERRIREIRASADRLLSAPYRGTRHDDLIPGLRRVTLNKAILWFDVDGNSERILAVFFGGQNDVRRMLVRLLSDK